MASFAVNTPNAWSISMGLAMTVLRSIFCSDPSGLLENRLYFVPVTKSSMTSLSASDTCVLSTLFDPRYKLSFYDDKEEDVKEARAAFTAIYRGYQTRQRE